MPGRDFLEKKTQNYIRKRNEAKTEFYSNRIMQKTSSEVIVQSVVTENRILRDVGSDEASTSPKISNSKTKTDDEESNLRHSYDASTDSKDSGRSCEHFPDSSRSNNVLTNKNDTNSVDDSIPKYQNSDDSQTEQIQNESDRTATEVVDRNINKEIFHKDCNNHDDANFQFSNFDKHNVTVKVIFTDDNNINNRKKVNFNHSKEHKIEQNSDNIHNFKSQSIVNSDNMNYLSKSVNKRDKMLTIRNRSLGENAINNGALESLNLNCETIPLYAFQPTRMCSTDYVRMSVRELIKYFENWKLFGDTKKKTVPVILEKDDAKIQSSLNFLSSKTSEFVHLNKRSAHFSGVEHSPNSSTELNVPRKNPRKRRRVVDDEDYDVNHQLHVIVKNKSSKPSPDHQFCDKTNHLIRDKFDSFDDDLENFLECGHSFESTGDDKALKNQNDNCSDDFVNENFSEVKLMSNCLSNNSISSETKSEQLNGKYTLDTDSGKCFGYKNGELAGKNVKIVTHNQEQVINPRKGKLVKRISSLLIFFLFWGGVYVLLKNYIAYY